MKKVLLVLLSITMCIFSCTATKPMVDNSAALKNHQQPYKIFSIGNWQPGYSIITLTDARQNYFTIRAASNPSLKIGAVYQPDIFTTD